MDSYTMNRSTDRNIEEDLGTGGGVTKTNSKAPLDNDMI